METTIPPPQRRTRRNRKRPSGPPTFQFVTATDPKQFRDQSILRGIRSQAMIQYRYKTDQQKKKNGDAPNEKSWVTQVPERPLSIAAKESIPMPPKSPFFNRPEAYMPRTQITLLDDAELEDRYTWLQPVSAEVAGDNSNSDLLPSAPSARASPSRYQQALKIVNQNGSPPQTVTSYKDNETTEERLLHRFWSNVSYMRNGVDPFDVLPKFEHSGLSLLALVRRCTRVFTSEATISKWIPVLCAHPDALLSSTCLVSTYLDMRNGCSGDSERTVIIKGEVISFINRRLKDPATQVEDMTLIVILHLFAGELWTCNEKTLAVHESGVARILAQRGGLHTLPAGALREVCVLVMNHGCIVRESIPLPIFRNYEPPPGCLMETFTAIPESPIYCPRADFFTIVGSKRCSEYTYELLCDMRELTDIFLNYHDALNTIDQIGGANPNIFQHTSHPTWFGQDVARIRSRLVSSPSAYTPGGPVSEDWIYESCRIAALIYVTAITNRVPFSEASDPAKTPLLPTPNCEKGSSTERDYHSFRLTDALYETLSKTDMGNVWGEMSGVLYWVTIIGATAARRSPVETDTVPLSREEAYSAWTRRCLNIFAMRILIILQFQHPVSMCAAQKRLLKVQEILGSGNAKRLV